MTLSPDRRQPRLRDTDAEVTIDTQSPAKTPTYADEQSHGMGHQQSNKQIRLKVMGKKGSGEGAGSPMFNANFPKINNQKGYWRE